MQIIVHALNDGCLCLCRKKILMLLTLFHRLRIEQVYCIGCKANA